MSTDLAGQVLGRFRVLERLGAGGMGVVYRARDEKLDRDVAIKILPEGLLADETARRRFRTEAHALSRLNHPHVATILDFDTVDGVDFLAMELVGGLSLEEAVLDGPLAEKEVLRLGAQLARGLQAAHDQGVVHRDLKPSNVRLTPDGLVKILDFGLARLEKPGKPAEETTTALTGAGTILGTPLYMSPEQVFGRKVDTRTDLYSAGALLYTLATGRRPHEGRAGIELFDAILHREVDPPRDLNPAISPGLEAVIVKLLDKDPERRYQSAREMVVDLERLRESSARSEPTGMRAIEALEARRTRVRRVGARAAGVAVVVALLALAAWLLRPPPVPKVREVRRITAGVGAALRGGAGNWATVVSDGVRAYYVANKDGKQGLWQVPIAGGDPVAIPVPFDGSPILAYVRSQSALLTLGALGPEDFTDDGMALWLAPVPAGSPRRVGRLHAWAAGLSPDETQVAFATHDAIGLAGIDGSNSRELMKTSPTASLRWSPDGRRLRYSAWGPGGRAWIWETAIERPSPRPLWPGQQGEWTADHRFYVFTRRGGAPGFGLTMSASGSDVFVAPERGWPWAKPQPVPLTFGPMRFQSPVPSREGGPLLAWGEIASSELQRLDRRTGRFEPFLPGTAAAYVDVSRDGEWVAWVSYPEGALWRSRADGSERMQLTAPPLEVHQPRFSPDGKRIAFNARSSEEPLRSIYVVSADGTDGGKPRLLSRPLAPRQDCFDPGWGADGHSVAFGHSHPGQMVSAAPGLYRVGLDGAVAVREPGAEAFTMPVSAYQGHLLARDASSGETFVRWAGKQEWERVPQFDLISPVWKRDGRGVCGLQGPPFEVRCHSFDTGRTEVLARVGQPLLAVSNFPAMFLDADDQPIVVVDRSARDIYALEWAN